MGGVRHTLQGIRRYPLPEFDGSGCYSSWVFPTGIRSFGKSSKELLRQAIWHSVDRVNCGFIAVRFTIILESQRLWRSSTQSCTKKPTRSSVNSRDSPDDFSRHIQTLFGNIIMRTTYGIDDKKKTAEFIQEAETLVRGVVDAKRPGRYLVNSFPFLKYIPAWFPGARFQRHFQKLAELSGKVHTKPFDVAKETHSTKSSDSSLTSMAAAFIEHFPEAGTDPASLSEAETLARNVCGMAYIAGVDTTAASARCLFYILATYPEMQRKRERSWTLLLAQVAFRLISDRPQLPYVHALVKELSRWYTAVPLGVVHTSTEDDEYDGYFIPKGTFFMPNTWAIMHDPEVFDRPFEFRPERFLMRTGKLTQEP
ncbi:cytochrome P450 [Ephemerocybe angulata]|uniref:Cytochrome P450 n=1 Tax=Ephemerocybe angulata TaxID=980116 RepID=A0A8H6M5F2_9AGAR|nr:cytochrome P450 [Tulosesus angulatus]